MQEFKVPRSWPLQRASTETRDHLERTFSILSLHFPLPIFPMLVIRRKVTREGAFTVLMFPNYYREWATSDYEHQEIMKLFNQDRLYEDIENDFTDFRLGEEEGQGKKDERRRMREEG